MYRKYILRFDGHMLACVKHMLVKKLISKINMNSKENISHLQRSCSSKKF